MPFLFAAVMRLSFALGFWSRDLLLRRVQEGFEAWKHGFNLVECLQPPAFSCCFFGKGKASFTSGSSFLMFFSRWFG
jgi:hypothetical protein